MNFFDYFFDMFKFKSGNLIRLIILLLLLGPISIASDDYIKGYSAAVLERQFDIKEYNLIVQDGELKVSLDEYSLALKEDLIRELSKVPGVKSVKIEQVSSENINYETEQGKTLLPRKQLFEPLIADPRWPHFSIGYLKCIDSRTGFKNVGASSFGETFIIFKDYAPLHSNWDVGIQASVFAIFDLDADSMDLINADYWIGFPVSYRKDDLSALLRIFHQSSHLGDEYLLGNDINRINLSYESVSLSVSYDFTDWFRVYAGASYMFNREPSELKPRSTQYGIEFRSLRSFVNGLWKPLGGVDVKNWEENGWDSDISARVGFQLKNREKESRKIHFMIEYFNGHSPNGQFYNEPLKYAGFGLHFYF